MSKLNLTVSIEDQQTEHFNEWVDEVTRAGFEVEQELKSLGVVTGKMDEEKVDKLKKVKGVANVEESRTFQLPPPESDVQ